MQKEDQGNRRNVVLASDSTCAMLYIKQGRYAFVAWVPYGSICECRPLKPLKYPPPGPDNFSKHVLSMIRMRVQDGAQLSNSELRKVVSVTSLG